MDQIVVQWQDVFRTMAWIYSLAWCLSFYGQICQNYRQKSVQGMNLNFAAINLNGFLFYALFNSYGYFIDDQQTGRIQMADLFFALHALAATFFTTVQTFIYTRGQNKLSNAMVGFITVQWTISIVYYLLVKFQIVEQNKMIGVVSMMGYYKLLCSLLKYIPQLLWNRKRKSTFGWSIFNVLMDLTGGIFSVTQIILEMFLLQGFKLNITKLLLGSLTIIYDLMFVYQHYVQYPIKLKSHEQSFEQMASDSPSSFQKDTFQAIKSNNQ